MPQKKAIGRRKNGNGVRRSRPRRESEGMHDSRKLPNNMSVSTFRGPITAELPKTVIGFPDRMITILKYSDIYNFSASAAPAAQVFRMNSGFDPDLTGTGHQPSWWDIYTAIYSRYFVRQFKMEGEIMQNSAATQETEWVACYADVDHSSETVSALMESRYMKSGSVAPPTGGSVQQSFSLPWMETAKLMGQRYSEADDNMYTGVGSNPTDVAFGWVKVQTTDAVTNASVRVRVKLYMEIVFKDVTGDFPSLAKKTFVRNEVEFNQKPLQKSIRGPQQR